MNGLKIAVTIKGTGTKTNGTKLIKAGVMKGKDTKKKLEHGKKGGKKKVLSTKTGLNGKKGL
jgi:hypothetical protein